MMFAQIDMESLFSITISDFSGRGFFCLTKLLSNKYS